MNDNTKKIISRVIIGLLALLLAINLINVIRYDKTPKLEVTLKEEKRYENGYRAIFTYKARHVKRINLEIMRE